MKIFSALLAICAGNSPATGEFPSQRPVTRRLDIFFDNCLNTWVSKRKWDWWFETSSRPLWRHCNGWFRRYQMIISIVIEKSFYCQHHYIQKFLNSYSELYLLSVVFSYHCYCTCISNSEALSFTIYFLCSTGGYAQDIAATNSIFQQCNTRPN